MTAGGTDGDRERNRDRMRRNRASAADLTIPPVRNAKRKARARRDVFYALRTYFPDIFTQDFTPQRRAIVEALVRAATQGGDQAIAAPRGEGKTSITECVLVWLMLTGKIRFPLLVAATGPDARRVLSNIKRHFEVKGPLTEDWPEVCWPIQALEGKHQRASGQTVCGERTYLKWAEDLVVLPTVKGSKASGAVLMTRGLDSAIRGIRVGAMRPDIVVIDDPETRESAASDGQIDKRTLIIDEDLAGVGGPGKRIARVILTTIMRSTSLSDIFTDTACKPSWSGKRLRFVESMPTRADLWEDYVNLRQTCQQEGDATARRAHQFYLEHRAEMDAGASVANPMRFIADLLPDGSQQEVSALQHAYNWIADKGQQSFRCELQNDPPVIEDPLEDTLTGNRVQRQVSGHPEKVVPSGCVVVTQGIDVGKRALHCVVRAWLPDGTGFTIERTIEQVHGTDSASDQGVDVAIQRAIAARMENLVNNPCETETGLPVPVDLTLVDAGYRTDAIYGICRRIGRHIKPAMGFGKSGGCAGANFHLPPTRGRGKRGRNVGDGWFEQQQEDRHKTWLVAMDADRWKSYEHDRWLTAPGEPGSMQLWGIPGSADRLSYDERAHHAYSRHIVAEAEIEEEVRGKLVRHWKTRGGPNHYLDASYMATVAAVMLGVVYRPSAKVVAVEGERETEAPAPTVAGPAVKALSFAEMKAARRR